MIECLQKLVKLLNLTTSDFDGEALNAIRAANRLLTANNLRWEDVVVPTSQPQQPKRPSMDDFAEIFRQQQQRSAQQQVQWVWEWQQARARQYEELQRRQREQNDAELERLRKMGYW